MRGIHNDRSCLRRDFLLKLCQIRLEGRCIRSNLHQNAVIVPHICPIFQEVRSENDNLFSGIHYSLQHNIQTAGSANRHDQIFSRKASPKTPVQRSCNCLPYVLKAGVAHISMHDERIFFVYKLDDRFLHALRCRNGRITKTEIKYIFRAVQSLQAVSFLKHHADRGIITDEGFHFFCYHDRFSFFYVSLTETFSSRCIISYFTSKRKLAPTSPYSFMRSKRLHYPARLLFFG